MLDGVDSKMSGLTTYDTYDKTPTGIIEQIKTCP